MLGLDLWMLGLCPSSSIEEKKMFANATFRKPNVFPSSGWVLYKELNSFNNGPNTVGVFADSGLAWSAQRISTAVFSAFYTGPTISSQ
jgi:hypothetical protein